MNDRLKELAKMVNEKVVIDKTVIIINGDGTSGKDYLIDHLDIEKMNISSITPFKNICRDYLGWNDEKTYEIRTLLNELKTSFCKYNEYSTKYLVDMYNVFIENDGFGSDVLFLHIGEQEEMEKFKYVIGNKCKVYTLCVRSDSTANDPIDPRYGTGEKISLSYYDYVFTNNMNEKSVRDFNSLIKSIIKLIIKKDKWVKKHIYIIMNSNPFLMEPYYIIDKHHTAVNISYDNLKREIDRLSDTTLLMLKCLIALDYKSYTTRAIETFIDSEYQILFIEEKDSNKIEIVSQIIRELYGNINTSVIGISNIGDKIEITSSFNNYNNEECILNDVTCDALLSFNSYDDTKYKTEQLTEFIKIF